MLCTKVVASHLETKLEDDSMQLRLTSDANWEARTGRVMEVLVNRADFFSEKFYGSGLSKLVIVLMCRLPELDFRKRVRFSKKNLELYSDVMLNYEVMVQSSMRDRMLYVADQINIQISDVVRNKKIYEFEGFIFLNDLKEWLDKTVVEYDGHTSGAWQY
ncbi:hypothetical protein [Xanthomonas hortorum]|uniref:hypothetical protein n=1 Tax=Xanthomonas hortorum TaxID=56454 RepID=UPI001594763E|nr:hypothetical protein [Xanthomonas hortorum]NHF65938.1 hypothetical protein [Xanthomonas hortorum]